MVHLLGDVTLTYLFLCIVYLVREDDILITSSLEPSALYVMGATIPVFATLMHFLPYTDHSTTSITHWPWATILYMSLAGSALVVTSLYGCCADKTCTSSVRMLLALLMAAFLLLLGVGVASQAPKPIHLHHRLYGQYLALLGGVTHARASPIIMGVGLGLVVHHYAAYESIMLFDTYRCSS